MVPAAAREKLLQRLGHHSGDRPPRHPGMLPHPLRKTGRHLDREHRRRLGNQHSSRPGRDLHVAAGPPLCAAQPPRPPPGCLTPPPPPPPPPPTRPHPPRRLHPPPPA